jgi:energy-coupling factor transporter transmembrane protein EcfT
LQDIEAMPIDDYAVITSIVTRFLPGFLRLGQQVLKAGSTRS